MTKRSAIVVGGGIGGLHAAWKLQQAGYQVTVLEASDQWGGVCTSIERDGCVLEIGPDSIISSKPAGVKLIRELGLEDTIQGTIEANRQAYIAKGNKLIAVPDGLYLMAPSKLWPFIWTKLISWRCKFRMLLDLILPRGKSDIDESLAQFVRRRLGKEALERIAQPMIGGIYTADPEKLSLQACMPQFLEMEAEHRSLIKAMMKRRKMMATGSASGAKTGVSGPRYGLFVSLRGGLQTLVNALHERLVHTSTLRLNTPVTSIQDTDERWQCTLEDGETLSADVMVLCAGAQVHARLCADFDQELSAALQEIPYADVATVNIAFPADAMPELPAAAGFVVPAVEQRNCIACTFSSQKYADRCSDNVVVLRAFVGGALHPDQLECSDPEMVQRICKDLKDLCAITCEPLFAHVSRHQQAMAQPTIGHLERVADIRRREKEWKTLALIGNAYEGVGIPDIIAQGEAALERIGG